MSDAQQVMEATATATTAEGARRVATQDGVVDTATHVAGESGAGSTTPEHLMAAALASCFQQALVIAGSTQGVDVDAASVEARVALRSDEEAGYTAGFALVVTGLDDASGDRVVTQARQICPFTKALDAAGITVERG
jgi:osmotically inducible protein OsmC